MGQEISLDKEGMCVLRPVCLTIAGLDPSGGAGVIADVKTFSAFECFATAAVTSLTFQNTTGVFGAVHQSAETVRDQLQPILNDFSVAALKTGMLPTREIIEETAHLIRERKLRNLVVDPVVRSTSGFDLIDDAALSAIIASLFPLADLVTPNIPEAERIVGFKITSDAEIITAARDIQSLGATNVLIKGGHFGNAECGMRNAESGVLMAVDYLFIGKELVKYGAAFIDSTSTHGTGCVLSAAIAANLALGKDLVSSVQIAKNFVTEAIATAPILGKGNSPINI